MDNFVLEISRKWHNPQVLINVGKDGLWEKMALNDFKAALIKEIGSVRWTWKQETLEAQVNKAFDNVIREIMGMTRSVATHIPVGK